MHVWPRIYTLNIDDATDRAFIKKSKQNIHIRTIDSTWDDLDTIFSKLDIIKLNGCINKPNEGFIFSPSEYAAVSNRPHEWYRQLGRDFLNYTFVFIGTKLDEPLFYQQIEYYKSAWKGTPGIPGRSYLITPQIMEIDQLSLLTANIEHIAGTLEDFVQSVDSAIDNKRRPLDLALARNPEIAFSGDETAIRDFSNIIKIDTSKRPKSDIERGRTREFYLGFKPTWSEVFDEVPAELQFQQEFYETLSEKKSSIFAIIGPAGSGKTTSLMILAKQLAEKGETVYYLEEPIADLDRAIRKLENINTNRNYYVIIDRASRVIDGLASSLEAPEIKRCTFVVGERLNVWRRRSEWVLSPFSPIILKTGEITNRDASRVLHKLQEFGPWSKISKLDEHERKRQLLEKSKRQLLIGLLELTVGYGFEQIISDDFSKLPSFDSKILVALTGLATIHGLSLSRDTCLAALNGLGVTTHIDRLLLDTQGIVHQHDNQLRARHPVYIDKLFDGNIPFDIKERAINGLLLAMTRHNKPISKNMSRSNVMLFKLTINHNFLDNFFHGKKEKTLDLFKRFEKFFELDGLFYLQYGLALRDAGIHTEALQKLQSAVDAWAMKQTEHAFAHQLLICALDANKEIAYRNLERAKEILLRLDSRHVEDDTDYPLVTLAEYHVKISRKFEDSKETTLITNRYIKDISDRQRRGRANSRLEEAKAELIKIATHSGGNKEARRSDLKDPVISKARGKIARSPQRKQ